jgi:hypothetical protein
VFDVEFKIQIKINQTLIKAAMQNDW